ncbi:MAG TPA: hypothetical protein VGQ58_12440 [Candidatus Limnocylindrales bacterium]|nr:hypothetical protein [Candidatus Limnocylindrales bacterium]
MPPPAPDEARTRVAATLKRLERIDVAIVVVARPDAGRQLAIERARDAAITAGRGVLLNEATRAARDLAMGAFARRGFSGTWAAADWSISAAGAPDRVAVAAAFDEAATAAVAEDLLDEETSGTLRATSEELAMMTGVPEPGALSTLGASRAATTPAVFVLLGAAALFGLYVGSVTGLVVGLAVGALLVGGFSRRRR